MTDTTTTQTTQTTQTTAATPWYQGKVDGEIVGHWQNKGYDVSDPVKVATELTKAYREAEKFIGAPANQLVRLPVDPIKEPDAMTQVWRRLGAPQDAKEYEFPALKDKDGVVFDAALDSSLRESLFKANVPKQMGTEISAAVAKYLNEVQTAFEAENAAALQTERETLAKNWGAQAPANKVVAQNAAAALGMTPEEVDALETVIGYARTMEMLRQIGSKIGEDKFIRGGDTGGAMSADQAQAKIAELKSDQAWVKRYLAGEKAAANELQNLLKLVHPER